MKLSRWVTTFVATAGVGILFQTPGCTTDAGTQLATFLNDLFHQALAAYLL